MVFNEGTMRERLGDEAFSELVLAKNEGRRLSPAAAEEIAAAMKDWAMEKGATHFTHWFQPMTGFTAEKHDAFIAYGEGGVIAEFSPNELIHGEPDASSFPSGGLRSTFEARGYTAWDPSSYAVIKDKVLCIPTAFISYGGEALDTKTPLLKSTDAISRQALRIVRLFGNTETRSIVPTAGPEQEYFLVDREMFERRKDLFYTGRTLFGMHPPKGQELGDHYFGTIKPRVAAFMEELDEELWKLGVPAKTEHNEAAPAQHELAPLYDTANIAADHNQLTMELMQKVARKHDMVCLLHERPFEGINGSGKHNNWSLATDSGTNLFEPGETPEENAQFLLLLTAVIEAVDEYQDLMRLSVASASNDRRLGAFEAPPPIISVFIGEELTDILAAIEKDAAYSGKEKEMFRVGVHRLPKFPKDSTDRNRTTPFAFTGNKFEFRMPGAAQSISAANTVLNTAVASVLEKFADRLEKAEDFDGELHALIRDSIREHRRILFSGNNYDEAWAEEAKKRGLVCMKTTPDAAMAYLDDKNIELFAKYGIFSRAELESRYKMKLDNYSKVLHIEAVTMTAMARKDLLPAISAYVKSLDPMASRFDNDITGYLTEKLEEAFEKLKALEELVEEAEGLTGSMDTAMFYKNRVLPAMEELRKPIDEAERNVPSSLWPVPTNGDVLFSVK